MDVCMIQKLGFHTWDFTVLVQSNKSASLPQIDSYVCTYIVHCITRNTHPKRATFALSERTTHLASHYTLVHWNR